MNRGFKIYYKEAIKTSFQTFKNLNNLLKIYFYGLINLLGRIIAFILGPIFMLSDIRVTKMIRGGKDISISESFETSDNPKSFWTMLVAWIVSLMMLLAGVALIGALGFVVEVTLSYLMYVAEASYEAQNIVMIVFSIPFAILLLVFIFEFFMYVSPINYTIDSIKEIGASQCLNKCVSTLREDGKLTLFTNFIVFFLINAVYVGIATGCVMAAAYSYTEAGNYLTYPLILIFSLVYLYFAPTFLYAYKCTKISLFEDLLLDRINVSNSIKGVYVKHSKTKKMTIQSYRDNLVRLFDETSDVDVDSYQAKRVAAKPIDKQVEDEIENQVVTIEQKKAKNEPLISRFKAKIKQLTTKKEKTEEKENKFADKMSELKDKLKIKFNDLKSKMSKSKDKDEKSSDKKLNKSKAVDEELKSPIEEAKEPSESKEENNIEKIDEKVETDDSNVIELNHSEPSENKVVEDQKETEDNIPSSKDDEKVETESLEETSPEVKEEKVQEKKVETTNKKVSKKTTKKKVEESEDGE